MQDFIMAMLQCPACHGELTWRVDRRTGDRIEEGEARCRRCDATYPVRESIGIFLTPDLPRNDLWETGESQLMQYLKAHPEAGRRLMETPMEQLNPADLLHRAHVHWQRGEYDEAARAERLSAEGAYPPEVQAAMKSQRQYVLEQLAGVDGPVVDLASGMGALVSDMAKALKAPIIATDFSPRVLRGDRQRFAHFGFGDRVSLLAFDARRPPFKDGAVQTMTTLGGLGNIEQPGQLLRELRRVVSGRLLAISFFCPEEDEVNGSLIRQFGMEWLLFRRLALQRFADAGWQVAIRNAVSVRAVPTPRGEVIEGAQLDGLPVVETTFEHTVIEAW